MAGGEDALRVFYLLFRRESFVLRDGAVTTFLQAALDEGRRYEERVAADLSGTVFEKVFPGLVGALADASSEELPAVREASLIFLYRLLFILYAEDRGLLDFLCGLRWLTAGMKKRERTAFEFPLVEALGSQPDDAYALLARGVSEPGFVGLGDEQDGEDGESCPSDNQQNQSSDIWTTARSIADRERFLHWQVAFPGVWQGWQDVSPRGGFDAVIGNPPWDRIKLQEVEWFASRRPEMALAPTAAARRAGIRQLRTDGEEPRCVYS